MFETADLKTLAAIFGIVAAMLMKVVKEAKFVDFSAVMC